LNDIEMCYISSILALECVMIDKSGIGDGSFSIDLNNSVTTAL